MNIITQTKSSVPAPLSARTTVKHAMPKAKHAESKADFVHKLHIALKEANETMYWLKVLYGSEFISKNQYDELMNNLDEIYKILFSSVKTAKEKLKS